MSIDTSYFDRCISTLEKAYELLTHTDQESIEHDLYRSACIKEFEIILEQSGKLLRKVLNPYYHSGKYVERLYFKDVFRQAVVRSIVTTELCEHFLEYRENRNLTAHDYGVNFAEEVLVILPQFIADSKSLSESINQQNNVTEK